MLNETKECVQECRIYVQDPGKGLLWIIFVSPDFVAFFGAIHLFWDGQTKWLNFGSKKHFSLTWNLIAMLLAFNTYIY